MSAYKIEKLNKSGWKNHDLCRYHISMKSPKSTGDKFEAGLEWASKNFKRVEIILSDTLQVHNGHTILEAEQMGNDWLNANHSALNHYRPVIHRWKDLKRHRNFAHYYNFIRHLPCPHFKKALLDTAESYLARNYMHMNCQTVGASSAFLVEELAVFACLFERSGLDMYGGSWFTDLFEALRPHILPYNSADYLQIDFTRRKRAA